MFAAKRDRSFACAAVRGCCAEHNLLDPVLPLRDRVYVKGGWNQLLRDPGLCLGRQRHRLHGGHHLPCRKTHHACDVIQPRRDLRDLVSYRLQQFLTAAPVLKFDLDIPLYRNAFQFKHVIEQFVEFG
uniref:Uncharacterized protein n=1 Tax=Candidatus Methanogaster sp. ANME-2c ERB4 TaxID=2759911 RepID=A0A7G9Y7M2_9EURY|nr:hypothetical protein JJJHGJFO_00002 [Methanosarcinales archaeon ANME-2c ERB4]